MKKFIITSLLAALMAAGSTLTAQNQGDYLGLPGDNLNLYAVMKLFQNSKTLEEFERNLNDPNSNINNLDLNGDNLVDYIKVIDNVDGDVHNIVLQDAVTPKENQDVAVFTVQRFQNGQVQIQLTGDEELYGKDYIIEPIYDIADQGGTPNPGYSGNTATVNGVTVNIVRTSPVQIAMWPVVRFIYMPSYTVWHSSWYWGYYPSYWHPWHAYSWNYYYGYQSNWNRDYYRYYHRWDTHRYKNWNEDYYTSKRSYSPDVRHQIKVGNYKSTYSHPEDRRNGEATFAKAHPNVYRRTTTGSSINTTRRTTTTVSNPNRPTVNNSSVNRRTTNTTITTKQVNNNGADKSGNTVVNRNVTKTNPAKTTMRTTTTVSGKQTGNSSSGQNGSANRTVTKSTNTRVQSSGARSNTKKTETSVKKVDKTNNNKDNNRR